MVTVSLWGPWTFFVRIWTPPLIATITVALFAPCISLFTLLALFVFWKVRWPRILCMFLRIFGRIVPRVIGGWNNRVLSSRSRAGICIGVLLIEERLRQRVRLHWSCRCGAPDWQLAV